MLFSCIAAANARFFDSGQPLDFGQAHSYFAHIPIHRLPGGAYVRASVFSLGEGFLATRWGGWRPVELKEG
jgi:hypothetical protein